MIRAVTGFSRRHPLVVIGFWVVLIIAGFTAGNGVFARLTATVGTVPGSQSDKAATLAADKGLIRPEINAILSGPKTSDPAYRTQINSALRDIRAIPGVNSAADPFTNPNAISRNGTAIQLAVALDKKAHGAGPKVADRIRDISGPKVTVSGGPLTDSEFTDQATSDTRKAEIIAAPVLLVLLLLVFGAVLAAGLPLLVALIGVACTFLALLGFSFLTDVSVYAIEVTTMLAIGLAVDYSLLVISRFRDECRISGDVDTALARTCASAGRTVVFSGLTVSVSLAGLLAFSDPFLRSIGLAGAAVVLIDMLAAITVLPAVLSLLGHRIRPAKSAVTGHWFARIAQGVGRAPGPVLAIVVAGMLAIAIPVLSMRLDTSNPKSLPEASNTRTLAEQTKADFPDQSGPNPIQLVVSGNPSRATLSDLRDQAAQVPGIDSVQVGPERGGVALLRAFPHDATNSGATKDAVRSLRTLDSPAQFGVTGDAAKLVDYQSALRSGLPGAAAIILIGSFLLLFLFTGSVLIPLKALATNLLSLGAALGIVVWIFQDGHGAGLFGVSTMDGIDLTVPVVVAVIAFGLSMDYEVFLVSRVREQWLAGADPQRAIVGGLANSGRIITAAALLLIVAFAGFLTGGFVPIKEVGLGLALAVAIDATVVRMVLVPAVLGLLGRAAWWAPKPLRRLQRRFELSDEPPVAVPAPRAAQPTGVGS